MLTRTICFIALYLLTLTPSLAFDLQGHRGARGLMPENTLPAFATALSIGVTTLELDTGVTKDGVVVVSHNPKVDGDLARGEDGKWLSSEPLVRELTFSELLKFDVGKLKPGSRAAKRFSEQMSVEGTRMPSLAQVFELVKKSGNGTVRFNIETKINPLEPDATVTAELFARALLAVISKHEMESRVSIQSFVWRTLQAVQKVNSAIETVYLTAQQNWLDNVSGKGGHASKWTAGFNLDLYDSSVPKMIKVAGGKVWSPFYRDLDESKIKTANGLGLKVIPWTINDDKDMVALIESQPRCSLKTVSRCR